MMLLWLFGAAVPYLVLLCGVAVAVDVDVTVWCR